MKTKRSKLRCRPFPFLQRRGYGEDDSGSRVQSPLPEPLYIVTQTPIRWV